jgi:hypothetical protein
MAGNVFSAKERRRKMKAMRQQMADMIKYLRRNGIRVLRSDFENLQPIYYKEDGSAFYQEAKIDFTANSDDDDGNVARINLGDLRSFLSKFDDDCVVETYFYEDYDDIPVIRFAVLDQARLPDDKFYTYLCNILAPSGFEMKEYTEYVRLKKKFEGESAQ